MDLITALFSVARQISDTDIDEINKLESKAKAKFQNIILNKAELRVCMQKCIRVFYYNLVLFFSSFCC